MSNDDYYCNKTTHFTTFHNLFNQYGSAKKCVIFSYKKYYSVIIETKKKKKKIDRKNIIKMKFIYYLHIINYANYK